MSLECPCVPCIEGNPFANLSAEGAEPFYYRAMGYCCDGQLLISESTDSYEDAYEDVLNRLLVECPDCAKPKKFCANATCDDGTLLTTVCVTTSQADADALAAAREAEMIGYCGDDIGLLFSSTCECPDGSGTQTVHSSVSQAVADAECKDALPDCGHTTTTVAWNDNVYCSVTCPDGNAFTYFIPAGRFSATTKAQANAITSSFACLLARSHKMCLGSITSECCISTAYSSSIIATGPFLDAHFNFWSVTGTLPPGLSLTYVGYGGPNNPITGTPTTAGTYSFTVRCTAPNLDYIQKTYTICVVDIASDPSPLPDADFGLDYTATLKATACATAPLSWQIVSGVLPLGLSLDEETGVISGICLEDPGDYTFTVRLQTSAS